MRGRPWRGAAGIASCAQDVASGIIGLLVGAMMLAGGEGGGGARIGLGVGEGRRLPRGGVAMASVASCATWPL